MSERSEVISSLAITSLQQSINFSFFCCFKNLFLKHKFIIQNSNLQQMDALKIDSDEWKNLENVLEEMIPHYDNMEMNFSLLKKEKITSLRSEILKSLRF